MAPERRVPFMLLVATTLTASACAGVNPMQAEYPKAAIRDLDVRTDGGQLQLRYAYPQETQYYSGGVNLQRGDGEIRVVIARCRINDACRADIPSSLPKPTNFNAAVSIPWNGERVVLIHADGEQQILP